MRFSIVTITLADVLPVAIVVAVQSIHYKGACPYSAHLLIGCTGEDRLRQERDSHCSDVHTSSLL